MEPVLDKWKQTAVVRLTPMPPIPQICQQLYVHTAPLGNLRSSLFDNALVNPEVKPHPMTRAANQQLLGLCIMIHALIEDRTAHIGRMLQGEKMAATMANVLTAGGEAASIIASVAGAYHHGKLHQADLVGEIAQASTRWGLAEIGHTAPQFQMVVPDTAPEVWMTIHESRILEFRSLHRQNQDVIRWDLATNTYLSEADLQYIPSPASVMSFHLPLISRKMFKQAIPQMAAKLQTVTPEDPLWNLAHALFDYPPAEESEGAEGEDPPAISGPGDVRNDPPDDSPAPVREGPRPGETGEQSAELAPEDTEA